MRDNERFLAYVFPDPDVNGKRDKPICFEEGEQCREKEMVDGLVLFCVACCPNVLFF